MWVCWKPPMHLVAQISNNFQSAVSPISNRQPCESCSALYYSKVSQAGSPATSPESFRGTQIGNLRYSGEAVQGRGEGERTLGIADSGNFAIGSGMTTTTQTLSE